MIKIKAIFSIGEVSKLKSITIKALRYYHKMGILVPSYIDEETGYRYYSLHQFIHIDIIKACRALGISIVELQQIFKECDTHELLHLLKQKQKEAKENMRKMQEVIDTIDLFTANVHSAIQVMKNLEVKVEEFDERYAIKVPCKEEGEFRELIYYSELDQVIEEMKISTSMDGGIYYEIDQADEIRPKYVFHILKGGPGELVEPYLMVIPKGKYMTLNYSKENEQQQREKLFEYLKENQVQINHFIEIDLFDDFFNIDTYSCQIQIRIEE